MSLHRPRGGAAGDAGAAQAGEAHQGPRPQPVHRHRRHHGDHAGIAAGHPHREGVHARSRPCSERIDASIAAVERNANKMARVSNRSSPLMETLGGFAVAGCLMYGGYSVVALGATPGQFFSFMTAFLLAYRAGQAAGAAQHRPQQPAGRRAHAAGNRRQPGERARRRRQAGAETDRRAGRIARRHFRLSAGRAGAQAA